jgi:hypothetical protein
MGDVGVVGCLLVVARRVGLGRGMVVPRGIIMMRGRVPVMLDLSLVRHVFSVVEGLPTTPGFRGHDAACRGAVAYPLRSC